jgi:hypothetical protein
MTGVYPYATRSGVRWRIAVGRQDGSTTTRRGYASREAAWCAQERLSGGRAPAAELSFGRFWIQWLADKRPYLTEGAIEDLEGHGTKRLLPHLAHRPLVALSEHDIREWMAAMIDKRDAGSLAPKTINNARAALSSALADATRRGLVDSNPCTAVQPLPTDDSELDYLRLHEINHYLEHHPLPAARAAAHRHRRPSI